MVAKAPTPEAAAAALLLQQAEGDGGASGKNGNPNLSGLQLLIASLEEQAPEEQEIIMEDDDEYIMDDEEEEAAVETEKRGRGGRGKKAGASASTRKAKAGAPATKRAPARRSTSTAPAPKKKREAAKPRARKTPTPTPAAENEPHVANEGSPPVLGLPEYGEMGPMMPGGDYDPSQYPGYMDGSMCPSPPLLLPSMLMQLGALQSGAFPPTTGRHAISSRKEYAHSRKMTPPNFFPWQEQSDKNFYKDAVYIFYKQALPYADRLRKFSQTRAGWLQLMKEANPGSKPEEYEKLENMFDFYLSKFFVEQSKSPGVKASSSKGKASSRSSNSSAKGSRSSAASASRSPNPKVETSNALPIAPSMENLLGLPAATAQQMQMAFQNQLRQMQQLQPTTTSTGLRLPAPVPPLAMANMANLLSTSTPTSMGGGAMGPLLLPLPPPPPAYLNPMEIASLLHQQQPQYNAQLFTAMMQQQQAFAKAFAQQQQQMLSIAPAVTGLPDPILPATTTAGFQQPPMVEQASTAGDVAQTVATTSMASTTTTGGGAAFVPAPTPVPAPAPGPVGIEPIPTPTPIVTTTTTTTTTPQVVAAPIMTEGTSINAPSPVMGEGHTPTAMEVEPMVAVPQAAIGGEVPMAGEPILGNIPVQENGVAAAVPPSGEGEAPGNEEEEENDENKLWNLKICSAKANDNLTLRIFREATWSNGMLQLILHLCYQFYCDDCRKEGIEPKPRDEFVCRPTPESVYEAREEHFLRKFIKMALKEGLLTEPSLSALNPPPAQQAEYDDAVQKGLMKVTTDMLGNKSYRVTLNIGIKDIDGWDFNHPCAKLIISRIAELPKAAQMKARRIYMELIKEKHSKDSDIKQPHLRHGYFDELFNNIESFAEAAATAISQASSSGPTRVRSTSYSRNAMLGQAPKGDEIILMDSPEEAEVLNDAVDQPQVAGQAPPPLLPPPPPPPPDTSPSMQEQAASSASVMTTTTTTSAEADQQQENTTLHLNWKGVEGPLVGSRGKGTSTTTLSAESESMQHLFLLPPPPNQLFDAAMTIRSPISSPKHSPIFGPTLSPKRHVLTAKPVSRPMYAPNEGDGYGHSSYGGKEGSGGYGGGRGGDRGAPPPPNNRGGSYPPGSGYGRGSGGNGGDDDDDDERWRKTYNSDDDYRRKIETDKNKKRRDKNEDDHDEAEEDQKGRLRFAHSSAQLQRPRSPTHSSAAAPAPPPWLKATPFIDTREDDYPLSYQYQHGSNLLHQVATTAMSPLPSPSDSTSTGTSGNIRYGGGHGPTSYPMPSGRSHPYGEMISAAPRPSHARGPGRCERVSEAAPSSAMKNKQRPAPLLTEPSFVTQEEMEKARLFQQLNGPILPSIPPPMGSDDRTSSTGTMAKVPSSVVVSTDSNQQPPTTRPPLSRPEASGGKRSLAIAPPPNKLPASGGGMVLPPPPPNLPSGAAGSKEEEAQVPEVKRPKYAYLYGDHPPILTTKRKELWRPVPIPDTATGATNKEAKKLLPGGGGGDEKVGCLPPPRPSFTSGKTKYKWAIVSPDEVSDKDNPFILRIKRSKATTTTSTKMEPDVPSPSLRVIKKQNKASMTSTKASASSTTSGKQQKAPGGGKADKSSLSSSKSGGGGSEGDGDRAIKLRKQISGAVGQLRIKEASLRQLLTGILSTPSLNQELTDTLKTLERELDGASTFMDQVLKATSASDLALEMLT